MNIYIYTYIYILLIAFLSKKESHILPAPEPSEIDIANLRQQFLSIRSDYSSVLIKNYFCHWTQNTELIANLDCDVKRPSSIYITANHGKFYLYHIRHFLIPEWFERKFILKHKINRPSGYLTGCTNED